MGASHKLDEEAEAAFGEPAHLSKTILYTVSENLEQKREEEEDYDDNEIGIIEWMLEMELPPIWLIGSGFNGFWRIWNPQAVAV